MLNDHRNGVDSDYSATEFINDLAAGMTGTMIMALGYLLTSLGLLHGRDKDEEDEINAITGVQEYSVNVGGHSYTVDWVTPVAFPLFVGSELYDQMNAGDDTFTMDDFFDALAGITEPLFSLSMMDGIQSMMQSYSSEGAIFEAGQSAVESYLGQYMPTIGGQLARTVAPEVHTAYYRDKTDALDDFTSGIVQKAMAKIPGLYEQLPEKVDVWGRSVDSGSPWYQRALENFLSPGYLNTIDATAADRLVQDVYAATGDTAVIPNTPAKYFTYNGERYDMSADEYVTYAKTRGQTAHDIVAEFAQSDSFAALTPDQQANCIDTAYKLATSIAKSQTASGYTIDTKWQREAYEAYLAGETTLAQAIIEYKIGDSISSGTSESSSNKTAGKRSSGGGTSDKDSSSATGTTSRAASSASRGSISNTSGSFQISGLSNARSSGGVTAYAPVETSQSQSRTSGYNLNGGKTSGAAADSGITNTACANFVNGDCALGRASCEGCEYAG